MRTISRIAFVFGLMNLIFGITGFIKPLVKPTRKSMLMGMFNRSNPSWLNTQPGEQFGLFATNWVHSLIHIMLAIPAFIPAVRNRFGQVYLGILAGNYALLSALGFMRYGDKSGTHMILGQAQNRNEYLLNSVLAGMGMVFAVMPLLRRIPEQLPSMSEIRGTARQATQKVTRKARKEQGEKMPA